MPKPQNEATVSYKSKRFAIRIVRLYDLLRHEQRQYVLADQVLRSGTSIGANIAEASAAISRKELVHRAQRMCGDLVLAGTPL